VKKGEGGLTCDGDRGSFFVEDPKLAEQ